MVYTPGTCQPENTEPPHVRETSEGNWAIDWEARCITVLIRLNAALEQTPQMEAKLPINDAPNQKNAAFIRG